MLSRQDAGCRAGSARLEQEISGGIMEMVKGGRQEATVKGQGLADFSGLMKASSPYRGSTASIPQTGRVIDR